jgi:hypothetical protein
MDTLPRILQQGTRPVAKVVAEVLENICDPVERLSKAALCVTRALELEEWTGEVAAEAWLYITGKRLWVAGGYGSLDAFKEAIDYDNLIAMPMERNLIVGRRKREEHAGILRNWGRLLDDIIPEAIKPKYLSDNLLKHLHRLSKMCKRDEATAMLRNAVGRRLQERDTRMKLPPTPYLLATDVLRVIDDIETGKRNQQNPDKSKRQLRPERQRKRKRGQEDASAKEDAAAQKHHRGPGRTMDSARIELSERSERAKRGAISTPMQANAELQEGEESEESEESEEGYEGEEGEEDEEDEEGEEGEESCASSEAKVRSSEDDQPCDACGCPNGIVDIIGGRASVGDIAEQVQVLQCLREKGNFEDLCRNHMRQFAGTALGMLNNIKSTLLCERLNYLFKERATLVEAREAHADWFRNQGTNVWRTTVPPLVKTADFDFNPKEVFMRFAGPGAWERWEEDGTIILPGLFDHLGMAAAAIDEEFEMYAFHQSASNARMGWTRNMYFSGVQQLMYQDPVLYALTAAARPDKQWRLIAYPYITKQAEAGESTGFVHVDLNLKRVRDEKLGVNRVQGSVSLDDENEQGCTLVVPGFHKRFNDFMHWKRFAVEDSDTNATTTGMKEWYGPAEKTEFGQLVPRPCPAYGARLSLSTIIHGSTKEGTQRRRVMFPWFTAIMEDHQSVEHPDCMQWQAIADSHDGLTGPTRESLGDVPRPGVAGQRFPGTVPVRSSYALCLALIGQKRWTEADVEMERNILLGSDDIRSRELAEDMRTQLLQTYKLRWKLMRECERQAFGKESFFRRNEGPAQREEGRSSSVSCGINAETAPSR